MTLLLALVLLAQQSEVDRIVQDFRDRQPRARTADEMRTLAREALEKLDALAKQGTDAGRARFHAGEMCLFLEDTGGALSRFQEAADKDLPKELLANARYLCGELSLQECDGAAARRWLGDFVKGHADDPRAFAARVMIELSLAVEGKPKDAIEGLAKLRAEFKGRDQEWHLAATIAAVQHFAEHNEEARAMLDEVARGCSDLRLAEHAKKVIADQACLGKQASLVGKDAAGKDVDLAKLRGRVVILYFYSASHPGAALEASAVRRILKACEGKDVSAIGVCLDRAKEDFDSFRTDLNITWPVIHDGGGSDGPLARQFGVRFPPYVLIVDRKGTIRFCNPMLTMAGTEMRALAERLLAEK